MKEDPTLERQQAILVEIVEYYLARRQAISARTLSKFSRLALSPTTIRNLMEDLSGDGYLTTEGVSRGRIPTQKAFVDYVTKLHRFSTAADLRALAVDLRDEGQPLALEGALGRVAETLARQTGFIAMAALPEKDRYPLDWVRLVTVPSRGVMVAVRSLFGDLWSKVLETSEPIPEPVLSSLEKYICNTYHGAPMEQVRAAIMSGDPIPLLEDVDSLGPVFRLLRRAFDWEKAAGWQVWGRENLYLIPEFQQPEELVRLHRALENPQLLSVALTGALPVEGGLVSIGTDTGYPGLENSSVVGFSFGDGRGWDGVLAVLGPMRMDYGMILPLVSHAAAMLEKHIWEVKQGAADG